MKVNKKLLIWREYTIFSFFSQTIDEKKRSSVENYFWLSQEYPPYRAPKGYRAYSYAVPRSEEASTPHGPMLPVVLSNHSLAVSLSPRKNKEGNIFRLIVVAVVPDAVVTAVGQLSLVGRFVVALIRV